MLRLLVYAAAVAALLVLGEDARAENDHYIAAATALDGGQSQAQTYAGEVIGTTGASTSANTVDFGGIYVEGGGTDWSDYETPAEQAPPATASSHECDTAGIGAQGVPFGASIATPTETCRALRLMQLQAQHSGTAVKLATITHYVGFPFRLLLHVATLGVLN